VNRSRLPLALAIAFVLAAPASAAGHYDPTAATPIVYKNCTNFNKKYPHGVGKAGARDKVKGSGKPVTTFLRSTRVYTAATKANSRLDGDKDGVACEKA